MQSKITSKDKVYYVNFGCRLNQYETDSIYAELKNNNISKTNIVEEATYIIINTCTVTNRSDSKNRNTIRLLHKKNPNAKIILTGCYATTNKNDLMLAGVEQIISNEKKALLPKIIMNETIDTSASTLAFSSKKIKFAYHYHLKNRARAYLKIQDGCNRACSYCKIPMARGKAISRDLNDCIRETKKLIDLGYQEITLTGVNIGDYADGSFVFIDLLNELTNLNGNFFLRISSLEPPDLNDDFLKIFDNQKIAQFLHIPIQSGAQKILKAMNRPYRLHKILDKIQLLRKRHPYIHIGTDIIVGFPGESEEDFQETINFCKKAQFANIHIFPFSKRKDTSIVQLLEKKNNPIKEVNGKIVKERIKILTQVKDELHNQYIRQINNQTFKAIIEKEDQENIFGTTENYLPFQISKKEFYKKNILATELNNKKSLKGKAILIQIEKRDENYKTILISTL